LSFDLECEIRLHPEGKVSECAVVREAREREKKGS